jgi:hypothetical protein
MLFRSFNVYLSRSGFKTVEQNGGNEKKVVVEEVEGPETVVSPMWVST